MFKMLASVLLGLVVLVGCSKSIAAETGQHSGVFTKTVCKDVRLNYLLYLPKDYGKVDKKWPMILFLHGAGERGDNIDKVKAHGPAKLAAEGKDFDFIIVSPQCPQENWWSSMTSELMALVNDISQTYAVDTQRLYITGLSMGGYGTWSMIVAYPDTFAAAAPICGGGDTVLARFRLNKMPLWVFHGAKDNVVPLIKSEEMVNAVKAGGNQEIQFTVYPEADHNSWTETYNNPKLYEWFLSHSK